MMILAVCTRCRPEIALSVVPYRARAPNARNRPTRGTPYVARLGAGVADIGYQKNVYVVVLF
jgi:hypothetical protein